MPKVKNLSLANVQKLYLDRFNNFFSDERFAEYYNLQLEDAKVILKAGAAIQETYVSMIKELSNK